MKRKVFSKIPKMFDVFGVNNAKDSEMKNEEKEKLFDLGNKLDPV